MNSVIGKTSKRALAAIDQGFDLICSREFLDAGKDVGGLIDVIILSASPGIYSSLASGVRIRSMKILRRARKRIPGTALAELGFFCAQGPG